MSISAQLHDLITSPCFVDSFDPPFILILRLASINIVYFVTPEHWHKLIFFLGRGAGPFSEKAENTRCEVFIRQ